VESNNLLRFLISLVWNAPLVVAISENILIIQSISRKQSCFSFFLLQIVIEKFVFLFQDQRKSSSLADITDQVCMKESSDEELDEDEDDLFQLDLPDSLVTPTEDTNFPNTRPLDPVSLVNKCYQSSPLD
jgi:hypothetical protein